MRARLADRLRTALARLNHLGEPRELALALQRDADLAAAERLREAGLTDYILRNG